MSIRMSIRAAPSFSLKDHLFNADSVAELAARLQAAHPGFPRARFQRDVLARFPALALKQRIAWMVTVLEAYLPQRFPAALAILERALPEPLDPTRSDDDFGHFIWAVPAEYAARHGCRQAYLPAALGFLRQATQRFTAEAALRPFLRAFPVETLAFVHDCAGDPNYHVRRLASEGIRPFLPWAPRVDVPLPEVIAVLDRLHADHTRYVTRSVANTLNDVSKLDPSLTVATLSRWRQQSLQRPEELAWMTRHALRTLLKRDHQPALELLGFPVEPRFRLSGVRVSAVVKVGESFEWICRLHSLAPQRLQVGLRLHFLKANGRHSPRVFKVADASLGAGERLEIAKRLPLRPATTRTLYPGIHHAELVVNGVARQRRRFELVP